MIIPLDLNAGTAAGKKNGYIYVTTLLMEKKYGYLGYALLLLFPLIFAGFYETYFKNFPVADKITYFEHLHALVAIMWVLLLVIQPILIRNKNYRLHKKLGRVSYFIFSLLILSFVPQIIKVVKTEPLENLFFPVADACLILTFYFLAIYYRRNIAKHMRYMIAGALVLLGPTIGRIGPILFRWSGIFTQNVQYGIIYSILIGLLIYDTKKLRNNKPYVLATGLFMLHQLVFYILFL
jgi:hypothetical protein